MKKQCYTFEKITLYRVIFMAGVASIFLLGNLTSSLAGIGSDVVPQIYEVDNFEDDIPVSNYPKYYATGNGNDLQVSQVTDPVNPSNKVLRIAWTNPSLPGVWWYSNTWDGMNPATILDATYYTHLIFKIRGTRGGEDFNIELQELGGKSVRKKATSFIQSINTSWQEIAVPLHNFCGTSGIDPKKVQAIAFIFNVSSGSAVYVDNIRFAGCLIDDFNDSTSTLNKLGKPSGSGGGDIYSYNESGVHKIMWSYWSMFGPPPYWYTVVEFNLESACLNPIYYNYLYFKVKGKSGGEHFQIHYSRAPGSLISVDSRKYLTITTNWQDMYIPLKDFTEQGIRREELNAIAFLFDDEGDSKAIYVDDIELRYVKHDPVVPSNMVFYKGYAKGFHIAIDPDGDPLIYQASNIPPGAIFDSNTGYLFWRPSVNGNYQMNVSVHEDRKDATVVSKVMAITVTDYTGFVKPQSEGPVQLRGRQLFVDGKPYKMKGVGYQPVPIGQLPSPSQPWYRDRNIFNRDFPILKAIGVNTIRTWGEPSVELLDAAYGHGIKVCVGYWVDSDHLDPTVLLDRNKIRNEFILLVQKLKGHPAVLIWAIGNENNYNLKYNKKEWYSLVNEMAQDAYGIERQTYHPVAVVNGNLHNIANMDMNADDISLPYLDIWGANVYHGYSFSGTLVKFAELSNKPLWVAEYGIDAYHTLSWHYGDGGHIIVDSGYLDEAAQAEWDANMAAEILASDVTVGGTIMAYSDEWWKAQGNWTSPSIHDTGGFRHGPEDGVDLQPDNFANEEYWGIVSISPDGSDIDNLNDITPRPVYYRLKEIFMPATVVRPGESIQEAIDNPSSSEVIHLQEGIYEVDAVIDVKNNKTLKGDGSASNIIIKGKAIFKESNGAIDNLTIIYPEGGHIEFRSEHYPEGILIKDDAGVTVINSSAQVKNCIIKPDLDSINIRGGYEPPLTKYGKGIQIWNIYGTSDISHTIENNLIINAETGIYLFSQKFGGAIGGGIQRNTLNNNNYGIIERMHKENPLIQNNIITNSTDGIHITYGDGTLLAERLANIADNDFWSNTHNVWCDETQSEKSPTGSGNIFEDPQYVNPPIDYTPLNPNCSGKGYRLQNPPSNGITITESFEGGWSRWEPDDDDEYCGFPPEYTRVEISQTQAYEGVNSISVYIGGIHDNGTGWVERKVVLSPNTTYQVNMSFWVWSPRQSDFINWFVVAAAGPNDPEVEADLARIGYTGQIAGWKEYTYSTEVTTDDSSKIYVACGISCIWETPRTYYLDFIDVTITPKR